MKIWKIMSIVLSVVLICLLVGGGVIFRNLALDRVCKNAGLTVPIGTQIGPGEGHIAFPIRENATTRVEAVAVVNRFPKLGDPLTANICLGKEVRGSVVAVNTVVDGRAVVTINTMDYGLITVGVVKLF